MFCLKNYHLHRQKTFQDKGHHRSLRGARNRRVRCDVAETGDAGARAWLPHGRGGVSESLAGAIRDSNRGADPDYVQGLAKLGIVKLPGYVASAGRSRPTK